MTMFFPHTIVDGFFENPDAIVDFANKQEFKPAEDGRWPGLRTKALHELCPDFFNDLCNRLFSVFYDIKNGSLNWVVSAAFQKVNKTYQDGWVHRDNGICTGIVYLSKKASIDSGTSICRLKSDVLTYFNPYEGDKRRTYSGELSIEESRHSRETINSLFEETLVVKNVYNRLFLFDSCQHHKANSFDKTEERLTLIVFVNQLGAESYPGSRIRAL